MFLGLRTAIYTVKDLARAKAWYSEVLGKPPYFDEPFYVGFEVGGYELGLVPDDVPKAGRPGGVVPYWGVDDIDAVWARLLELGATEFDAVADVGGDIRIGSVLDPEGNELGVIQNPHFKAS